jgi:hypothetical protein
MKITAAIAFALPASGCIGSASMILKPPIVERCKDAGLRGCDDLTDGVVDYVEGDKDTAEKKIKRAVAANEPDRLREFADKIRLLKSVPGVEEHMGPLAKVADLLAGPDTTEAKKGSSSERATSGTSSAHAASGEHAPRSAVAGSLVPLLTPGAHKCTLLVDAYAEPEPGSATCAALQAGPLTLTDLHISGGCSNALVFGAGAPASPSWYVLAAPGLSVSIHGSAYPVKAGESLFAAQVVADGSEARRDARCTITWAASSP